MLGFTKRKDTNRQSAKKQTVTFNKRHRGHFCHNGGRSSFSFFVVVSSSFFSFKRDVISVVLISNVCQLSYIFNNDPCNSHDTPQFIGSLTHVSTVIVFCRVPNYKPVVINNMPVEGGKKQERLRALIDCHSSTRINSQLLQFFDRMWSRVDKCHKLRLVIYNDRVYS